MAKSKKKKGAAKNIKPPVSKKQAPKNIDWKVGGVLFLFAFLLYANTLGHQFALDDHSVLNDSHIVTNSEEGVWQIFGQPYRYGSFGEGSSLYRPLSIFMFKLEWMVSPENGTIHHLINVLFFGLTCMFTFLTFRKVLDKYSIWLPLTACLLFAAHPIHTEVVANIKSRDEILAFFFGIMCLYYWWDFLNDRAKLLSAGLSLAFCVLSLFSKENAVVNFLVLIPMTVFFFRNKENRLTDTLVSLGVFAVPTAIFLLIRSMVLGNFKGVQEVNVMDNFMAAANGGEHFATGMVVLGKYVMLLFVPYPLICDYNYNHFPLTDFSDYKVWLSILLYVGMILFALAKFRKEPIYTYGILFYLASMVLYSNLLFLIGAGLGERFLYVGSFGFCLVAAALLLKYLGDEVKKRDTSFIGILPKRPKAFLGVLGGILIVYSIMTIQRNFDWYDSFTLYQADILKAPESARLNGYLGTGLIEEWGKETDPNKKKELLIEANKSYSKAVSIFPNYTEAYGQIGLTYYRLNNLPKAKENYEKAIADPKCKGSIYSNYGTLLFNSGDIQGAQRVYHMAIQREAHFVDGLRNLGITYAIQGNHAKAVEYFRKALEYKPEDPTINHYLGTALTDSGNKVEGKRYLDKAKSLGYKK